MDLNLEAIVACLGVASFMVASGVDLYRAYKIDKYGLKPDSKYFNLGFSGYAADREKRFTAAQKTPNAKSAG